MRLVINIRIPQNIVRELNIYRKKYNPTGISHSSAHITLVPPFILRGKFQNLTKDIASRLKSVKQFRMRIDRLGWFGNQVLFIKPDCPPSLKQLHAALKKLVQEKYRLHSRDKYWTFKKYSPHITISTSSTLKIRQFKRELKGFKYKKTFTVDGVSLYTRRRDGRWILKKVFLFSKSH